MATPLDETVHTEATLEAWAEAWANGIDMPQAKQVLKLLAEVKELRSMTESKIGYGASICKDLTPITKHEGSKYLKLITCAVTGKQVQVDVYAVLEAFGVTCPARQHAIKKLLMAGGRGKGDAVADLVGVLAATNRAIELEKQRSKHDGKHDDGAA